jgi:arylsulfatase A-like enzyme
VLTRGAKSPHDAILLLGTVPGKAAVRMGDWKLLLNASEKNAEEALDDEAKSAGTVELYHLADDIAETKNLAPAQPAKVKELRARLDALLKDAAKPGNSAVKPGARKNASPQ